MLSRDGCSLGFGYPGLYHGLSQPVTTLLSRHELDISELFEDPYLAHTRGRRIWRIEDFKPVEVCEGGGMGKGERG